MKASAPIWMIFGGEEGMMGGEEGLAETEAEAETVDFCGKERLEDLLELVRGNSWAGVVDADMDVEVGEESGSNDDFFGGGLFGHGVAGIGEEVEEDLGELDAVAGDGGEIFGEVSFDDGVGVAEIGLEKAESGEEDVVDLEGLELGRAFFEEGAEVLDYRTGVMIGGDDILEGFGEFGAIGVRLSEETLGGLGVAEDDGEWLIEFVSEGGGKFVEEGDAGEVS